MNMNLHQAQSHDILRSWQSQRNDISHRKDFVLPLFIGNDDDAIQPIDSMPDVYRYGCNRAIEYLEPLIYKYGLRSVLLFPVVTKSDRCDLDADDDDDDDDDDGVDRPYSSSDSIQSSSSSSSSDGGDNNNVLAGRGNVMPERLIASSDTTPTSPNSQNPFLNQMHEEEEDHLLASEQVEDRVEQNTAGTVPSAMRQPPPPATVATVPAPPPRANESRQNVSRAQDVRLIKGMALKDKYNPVLRLIPRLRTKFPNLLIICDVCLCAFTSTGHCCLFEDHSRVENSASITNNSTNNDNCCTATNNSIVPIQTISNNFPISNKITCQYLAILAVEYALKGCNVVAPSDMMDGRILTIRERLNENSLHHVSIMSYSAKFASAFYGPFRQATNNAPEFGDRRAYQLPPGSRALALKAVQRDINQGADFVMVKPALAYLDIVRDIRVSHPEVPVAVYQVSGEYSMLKISSKAGVIDLKQAVTETLTAYRRAGATIIISYFTPEILRGELLLSDDM